MRHLQQQIVYTILFAELTKMLVQRIKVSVQKLLKNALNSKHINNPINFNQIEGNA